MGLRCVRGGRLGWLLEVRGDRAFGWDFLKVGGINCWVDCGGNE